MCVFQHRMFENGSLAAAHTTPTWLCRCRGLVVVAWSCLAGGCGSSPAATSLACGGATRLSTPIYDRMRHPARPATTTRGTAPGARRGPHPLEWVFFRPVDFLSLAPRGWGGSPVRISNKVAQSMYEIVTQTSRASVDRKAAERKSFFSFQ